MNIKKAIVLAGGQGTRISSVTHGSSKEMLNVGGLPVIEHSIRELIEAGCTDIGVIINEKKTDLKDYLEKRKNVKILYTNNPNLFVSIVEAIKTFVGRNPFVMVFPDMLYLGQPNATQMCLEAFEKYNKSVLCLFEESKEFGKGKKYIEIENVEGNIYSIKGLNGSSEKKIRVFTRYIFSEEIFDSLDELDSGDSEVPLLSKLI